MAAQSQSLPLQQIQQKYAGQITAFNSPILHSSINWLLANGYTLGNILAVVWANLPEILAIIRSTDSIAMKGVALLNMLISLLGEASAQPVQTTKIG